MAAPIPSVDVTPATSGKLPFGVFFDATGTTTDLTNDFRDPFYMWNFGDSDAGSWDNGANTSQSKNFATGAIASHVYENAGTYTWTLIVYDGTTAVSYSDTITVSDWANDSNTICVGNVLPVAGVGGVPSNATCVASSDFYDALSTYLADGKRVLFNRGDTFTQDTEFQFGTITGAYVGAYGSGAKPLIDKATGIFVFRFASTASDIKIVDLQAAGQGITDLRYLINQDNTGTASDVVILRCDVTYMGLTTTQDGTNGFFTNYFMQDCTASQTTGNVTYFRGIKSAIMGGNFGPYAVGSVAEHIIRVQQAKKMVIANNTMTQPGIGSGGKHCLTIRAKTYVTTDDDTQYILATGNKLDAGTTSQQISTVSPSADSQDEHIYDVILERNWYVYGAVAQLGLKISAVRVTVRNNIFQMSGGADPTGINVYNENINWSGQGGTDNFPTPTDNWFLNNTIYSSDSTTAIGITIGNFNGWDNGVTNTVVGNNLYYTPLDASPDFLFESAGKSTGTTGAAGTNGNSSDVQGNTDPFVTAPTTPLTFVVSASAYAADGGVAQFPAQQSDFFNAFDKSGDNRMGAIVQNGEQQIKGVAA